MTYSQPKLKSKGDGPHFRPFEVKQISKRVQSVIIRAGLFLLLHMVFN